MLAMSIGVVWILAMRFWTEIDSRDPHKVLLWNFQRRELACCGIWKGRAMVTQTEVLERFSGKRSDLDSRD